MKAAFYKILIVINFLVAACLPACFEKSGSTDSKESAMKAPVRTVRVYPSNVSETALKNESDAETGKAVVPWIDLFDNNVDSSCVFDGDRKITVTFNREVELAEVSIYGLSGKNFIVSKKDSVSEIYFSKDMAGAGTPASASVSWIRLTPSAKCETKALDIIFSGEGSGKISEIVFWEKNENAACDLVLNDSLLEDIMDSGSVTYPAKLYTLTPDEFNLETGNNYSAAFTIDHHPGNAKRAYLIFEGYNLFRSVSLSKNINGNSWTGGFDIPHTEDTAVWKNYFEEISPECLKNGQNNIEFRINGSSRIRKAGILVVYYSGWNLVNRVSEYDLYDGDISTSVKLLNGMTFDTIFQKESAIEEMLVYSPEEGSEISLKAVKGVNSSVLKLTNESYTANAAEKATAAVLKNGWNRLVLDGSAADSIKANFYTLNNEGAKISEIRVRCLPLHGLNLPEIKVTFPVNGEFFGRTAYLQGFTAPVPGVGINVEGKADGRNASDGSFSISLSKDETRYSGDTDDAPWDPVVSAAINGQNISREINLFGNYNSRNNDNDGGSGDSGGTDGTIGADGTYTTTIYPDKESTISIDGMTILIPKGAVDKETVITIKPLGKEDLPPLDPGMINVTHPAAGYRFLPHGTFNKFIEIYFQYLREKLKKGQADNDVFMYYHDTKESRWKRLERVKVEPAKTLVTSKTNHFTDIINATITTPEHPDPLLFNPNTIKDLKAGDPAAGITMMEAPKMTNTGEAGLTYPIDIPKGRRGMQPSVALKYTSGTQNSWCGVGWDIAMQSISIDTKYGVPRYDGTETYLLNGMPLVKDEETGYYRPRIEGGFARIQRIGSGPSTYYWEVTEKSGVKYIYGRTKPGGATPTTCLARHSDGAVFQWFLERVIDTYGNTIDYVYFMDEEDGGDYGRQLYISHIDYTGFNGSGEAYSVVFNRKNERTDAFSNCRAGFKVVTRHLLENVEVMYGGSVFRRYVLTYTQNPFGKNTLERISQQDAGGRVLAEHVFDYYDDYNGAPGFLKPEYSLWNNVINFTRSLLKLPGETSGLGSTEGHDVAVNLTGTISPFTTYKWLSVGGQIGVSNSISKTLCVFLDIDGDNLTDQVFTIGNKVMYRKNKGTAMDALSTFDDGHLINGLSVSFLGTDKQESFTYGGIINLYASFCKDKTRAESTTDGYFADVNGDGLIDYVDNGKVLYNKLGEDGVPNFSSTPPRYYSTVSFSDEGNADTSTVDNSYPAYPPTEDDQNPSDSKSIEEIFYLDDPVRMWRVPFDGYIRISGLIRLPENNNPEATEGSTKYEMDDGLKAIIQLNNEWNNILYETEITKNDHDYKFHDLRYIYAEEGDRIFFRINSLRDGAYDIVEWDPVITYEGRYNINRSDNGGVSSVECEYNPLNGDENEPLDENGLPFFKYRASQDFNLAGKEQSMSINTTGSVDFSTVIHKTKATSDDVTFELLRFTQNIKGERIFDENPAYTYTIGADETGDFPIEKTSQRVNAPVINESATNPDDRIQTPGDNYIFRVTSDTPVDLNAFYSKSPNPVNIDLTNDASLNIYMKYDEYISSELNEETEEFEEETQDAPMITEYNSDGDMIKNYSSMQYFIPATTSFYKPLYPGASIPWTATESGIVTIEFEAGLIHDALVLNENFSSIADEIARKGIKACLAVKKDGKIVTDALGEKAKATVSLGVNNTVQCKLTFSFEVNADEKIYFIAAFDAERSLYEDNIYVTRPLISYNPFLEERADGNIFIRPAEKEEPDTEEEILEYAFNGGYRNWYYGRWKGNNSNFDTNKIEVITKEKAEDIQQIDPTDQDAMEEKSEELNNIIKTFTGMTQDPNPSLISDYSILPPSDVLYTNGIQGRWNGHDSDTWISREKMSSTRVGRKNIEAELNSTGVPATSTNIILSAESPVKQRGVVKRNKSSYNSTTGNVCGIGGAYSKGSSDTLVDFFDLNGDGFPDIVKKNGLVQFTNKQGQMGSDSQTGFSGGVRNNESNNYNLNVGKLGCPSVQASGQQTKAGGDGFTICLMDTVPTKSGGGGCAYGETTTKADFIDVNGDGLPDRVTDSGVQLNMGYRFGERQPFDGDFRTEKTATLSTSAGGYSSDKGAWSGGLGISFSQAATESTYIDVNGDGLPDKLVKKLIGKDQIKNLGKNIFNNPTSGIFGLMPDGTGAEGIKVKYNLGSGFGPEITWKGELPYPIIFNDTQKQSPSMSFDIGIQIRVFGILICTIHLNPGMSYARTLANSKVTMADINGDGFVDHVVDAKTGLFGTNALDVRLNRTGRTGLLKSVTRPLGGKIVIEYERKGNTSEMPQSRWVMSSVTQDDGMAGLDTLSSHTYRTTYEYTDGKYDRGEREFFGFANVTERQYNGESVSQTVEHGYLTVSYYMKGIEVLRTVRGNDNKIYSVVSNTVMPSNIVPNSVFPALTQKTTEYYEDENTAQKTHVELYDYDDYGNIIEYTDLGDENYDADNVKAVIKYDTGNGSGTYIMSNPTAISVQSETTGSWYRNRKAVYNTKGSLTRIEQYVEDNTYTVTKFVYDLYGNLEQIEFPKNNEGETYWEKFTYDSATRTNITKITDAFGYSSGASYDMRFQSPVVSTDTNGNSMTYAYDNFGRVTYVYGPYDIGHGAAAEYHYMGAMLTDEGAISRPATCLTRNKAYWNSPGKLDTVVYVDGLKRTLQTRKSAEVNGQTGMTVSGRVVYDGAGRVLQEGQPGFISGSSYTYSVQPLLNATTYTYDPIGRKSHVEFPDGTDMGYDYSTASDGTTTRFTTKVTDQKGYEKTQYLSTRGTITRIDEEGGITTKYSYNLLNEITKITDAARNETNIKYDNLGRRTEIDNKDTGRITFEYDDAGNLIKKITPNLRAKEREIKYFYYMNRLIRVDYPFADDVYHYYGASGAAYNRAGRLFKTMCGIVKDEKKFGRLGETVEEARSITWGGAVKTYVTKYEWDNFGRMRYMQYPDGEMLWYGYDIGGLLKSAKGSMPGTLGDTVYIKDIQYDKYGSRTRIEYGNGAVSTLSYDADMHRLTGLKTVTRAVPDGATEAVDVVLQNISYEYDEAGNILERENSGYVTTGAEAKTAFQEYGYDRLHRLTSSEGKISIGGVVLDDTTNSYENTFDYNSIGNITKKMQSVKAGSETTSYIWPYSYTANQPHAVTSAGTKTFTYDHNGNMATSRDSVSGITRTLAWDDENRLKQVTDAGASASAGSTSFVYDASGTRVVKSGNMGDVVYVSANYGIRNSELISKHVFAGNTRVATKLVSIETQDGATTRVDKGAYYYHGDHLGSSSVITDNTGKFYEHILYFPYGEDWVDEKASSTAEGVSYKYTAKEYDPETGLYYYGARYYMHELGLWPNTDPALNEGKYFPEANDFDTEHDYYWYLQQDASKKLPGIGGVFNSANLNPYHYAGNNPVKFVDPDGKVSIEVTLPKGREDPGVMIVRDDFGAEMGRYEVLGRGTGGRDQMQRNADTPTGTYTLGDVAVSDSWDQNSYGNTIIVITPESGKAKDSNRAGIRIHAGREANSNSAWDTSYRENHPSRKGLRATHGCLRTKNKDIKNIANAINEARNSRGSKLYNFRKMMYGLFGIKPDTKDTLKVKDK